MKKTMMALALSLAACDSDASAAKADELQNLNPAIASPDSNPHGKTYGEWAAAFWTWAFAQPAGHNPLTDETGADCAAGQSGSVWFLAGNFGGETHRECAVPTGRAIFVPMSTIYWIQTLQDPAATADELRAQVRTLLEGTTVSATLDGRDVVDPTRYYEESPVITAHLPLDNVLGYDATNCVADGAGLACQPFLDAGYYLFIKPLAAGDHVLHFTGHIPAFDFSLDVTYTLHVH